MVVCACGKTIDKLPAWLASVDVEFVCNNCPKRQVKTITQLHAEQVAALPSTETERLDAVDVAEVEDEEPEA